MSVQGGPSEGLRAIPTEVSFTYSGVLHSYFHMQLILFGPLLMKRATKVLYLVTSDKYSYFSHIRDDDNRTLVYFEAL